MKNLKPKQPLCKLEEALFSHLPLKPEVRIFYPFTQVQTTLIQGIVGDSKAELEQVTERGVLSLFNLKASKEGESCLDLRDYLCLLQIADHPSVVLQSEKLMSYLNGKNSDFDKTIKKVKVNYSEPGKLQSIMHLVTEILSQVPNDKILIFTNFEKMGHLICEGLKASTITPTIKKVEFLYGKVKKEDRPKIIHTFQKREGPPVLVAGRKLGSVGWNCTGANHLILVDPWWNPNDDDQCIGRIYRIGQTKPVHVYRMHQTGFVADDKMNKLRIEKKAWCELILSADVSDVSERIRDIIEGNNHSVDSNNFMVSDNSKVIQ